MATTSYGLEMFPFHWQSGTDLVRHTEKKVDELFGFEEYFLVAVSEGC